MASPGRATQIRSAYGRFQPLPRSPLLLLLAVAVSLTIAITPASSASPATILARFPAIFVFGDSLSDTGNAYLSGLSYAVRTSQAPYGETFPGWPADRFSDGRLLVDLFAVHVDLPLLNPLFNRSADFSGGVNYAVAGATALDTSLLSSLGIYPSTNLSIGVQLSWHLDLLEKVQASEGFVTGSPIESSFYDGLYVVEIGGNDYIHSYFANNPVSFVLSTIMPLVISQIHDTVESLLNSGAKNFLFMSITPLGCSPAILSTQEGSKDAAGCLEDVNYASYVHGMQLQEEVESLRVSYPHASFLLMDFYGAYMHVLKNHNLFGFTQTVYACCGAGESFAYNFNLEEWCNSNSPSICDNPAEYISWDGFHHTDSFHRQIFNQTILAGSFLDIDSQSVI